MAFTRPHPDSDIRNVIATALGTIILSASILNCAWVCDDAYITFRSIDNWINGYGLRWNIAERVQAFTHPLWLLLLTPPYALFGNIFYVSLILSFVFSLATVLVVTRCLSDHWMKTVWICLALAISKAYVDFSTSGLENPLIHALLASFLVVFLRCHDRHRATLLFVFAGLIGLNRLDGLVIIAPPLAWEIWQTGSRRTLLMALVGFSPLFLWLVFSTIYYGNPLPNTAYAKLNTGVSRSVLLGFGLDYFKHSARMDPITLSVVSLALLLAIYRRSAASLFAVGIVSHGLYLLWIGGDFMSGRFFTSMYLVSVVLVCTNVRRASHVGLIAVGSLIVVYFTSASPVWARWSDNPDPGIPDYIVDERAHYFNSTGLIKVLEDGRRLGGRARVNGRFIQTQEPLVAVHSSIGMVGFYAGPDVHIIDRNALADPFLARLPTPPGMLQRPGHYARSLPRGYVETIWRGENRIVSPHLRSFYEAILRVTRADLFSVQRLKDLIAINFGLYDPLSAKEIRIDASDLSDALAAASEDPKLGAALQADASKAGVLTILADRFIRAGEIGRAAAMWGIAQRLGADGDGFWELGARLARELQIRDQGRLALKILEMCVAARPDDRRILVALAQAFFSQGDFRIAAIAAQRGFDFEEPTVEQLLVVADVSRISRLPEAELNYRTILELDPQNDRAIEELLAIQSEKRNPSEANR